MYFQTLWKWTYRILLKYHFLHFPPNTETSLITLVKIKHPSLSTSTPFLCLLISVALRIRHWLPESQSVLICLGSSNKPQTGWHINNRNLFLTVVDAGKSKIRCLEIPVWWGPLSGSRVHTSGVFSPVRRDKRTLSGLFYKDTHPFTTPLPSDPITSQRPTPNTITSGIKMSA